MDANQMHRPLRPRHYWRNLLAFAFGALVTGLLFVQFLGIPVISAYGYTHPKRAPVCCITPADWGLKYEEVAFVTRDGLTLRGWYLPSRNRAAVIALHPIASNRLGVLDHAALLARHGYGVLLLDLRAHGASDGAVLTYGGDEAEDVVAAARWLQSRADVDPQRIGALGLSLGAQVSILGAARTDAVQAVVADGGGATTPGDWGPPHTALDALYVPVDTVFYEAVKWDTGEFHPLSLREALARLAPRPLLMISAGPERVRLEFLFSFAGEPKELWVIPEAAHIEGLKTRPAEYERRVTEFFDQALLR
jgi:pimeloyl-ACP methyl ester carboxylesterase